MRVEVRIGCIREACRPLPDSSLVSGLQNRGCERAGGVLYTTLIQGIKKKILNKGGNANECEDARIEELEFAGRGAEI